MRLDYRNTSWVTDQVVLSFRPLKNLRVLNIAQCADPELTAGHLSAINAPLLEVLHARHVAWSEVKGTSCRKKCFKCVVARASNSLTTTCRLSTC